jgi:hypothetical protein
MTTGIDWTAAISTGRGLAVQNNRHQNQRFDIYLDVLIFRDDCFQLFK